MKPFKVYLVKHIASGKGYVGVTQTRLANRLSAHASQKGSSLHADLKRYGRDAFIIEVLHTTLGREEAYQTESEMMVKHGTLRPKGYNLTCRGVPHGNGGPKKGNTNARAVGVRQLTLDGKMVAEFRSVKQAGELSGTNRRNIQLVLNGTQVSTKGFRWERIT